MVRPAHTLFFALLATAACKKERPEINNQNNGHIVAMGHGGMGIYSTYPLDSPAGILSCLASDADGSEMDVQLTSDSMLVAYHGADLSEATDMSGPVWRHTWAEVQQARYNGPPYSDHHIMSLDAFFEHVDVHNRAISLDVKLHSDGTSDAVYFAVYLNAILRLIDRHNFGDRLFIESQSPQLLSMLKTRRSDLKLFYYPLDFADALANALSIGATGISIDMRKINAEQLRTAHEHGLWVILWNAQSNSDNTDAINMGPEVIQTDRLENLIGSLE